MLNEREYLKNSGFSPCAPRTTFLSAPIKILALAALHSYPYTVAIASFGLSPNVFFGPVLDITFVNPSIASVQNLPVQKLQAAANAVNEKANSSREIGYIGPVKMLAPMGNETSPSARDTNPSDITVPAARNNGCKLFVVPPRKYIFLSRVVSDVSVDSIKQFLINKFRFLGLNKSSVFEIITTQQCIFSIASDVAAKQYI